jgi:hypothetical protein
MGCDIHFVLERKVDHLWLGVAATNFGWRPHAKDRNYLFFGELAGVRCDSSKDRKPIGLPETPSMLTKLCVDGWASDGHSHSWLTLRDFCQDYIDAHHGRVQPHDIPTHHLDSPWDYLMGIYFDEDSRVGIPDDYRVIFWFDN